MEAITNNKVVSTHTTNKSKQSVTNKHSDIKTVSEKYNQEDKRQEKSIFKKSETKIISEHNSKSKTSIINEVLKESKVSGIKL